VLFIPVQGGHHMLNKIFHLYYDGFRSMVVGRVLWKIIFLKLFIMFAILKVFFFPDFLATNFTTDAERANHVLRNLTQSAGQ
jgi:hypothetical protein